MIFVQTNENYQTEILTRLKDAFPVHFCRVLVNYMYSADPEKPSVYMRLANIREDQSHRTLAWDCRTQLHALVAYDTESSKYSLDFLGGHVARSPKGAEVKLRKRVGDMESCVNYFLKQVENTREIMDLQLF